MRHIGCPYSIYKYSPKIGPEIDERRANKKIVRRALRVFLWSIEELYKHTIIITIIIIIININSI